MLFILLLLIIILTIFPFLLPFRTEKDVQNLPYFTIGLIVVNFIVWVGTSNVVRRDIKELRQIQEHMFQIESRHYYEMLEKDPLVETYTVDERWQKILNGELISVRSWDYIEWNNYYNEFTALMQNQFFQKWGFKPNTFNLLKIFTSMFLHANFFHLFGNMLFLWLVGCNVEDIWGWKVFLGLYMVSGILACFLHGLVFHSSTIPLIGASGAIAGVMGAFMVRFYKIKIRFLYIWLPPLFFGKKVIGTFRIYAGIVLPVWFLMQIWGARWSSQAGVAYWAHIGGFVFGALLSLSFGLFDPEERPALEDDSESEEFPSETDLEEIGSRIKGLQDTPDVVAINNRLQENPEDYITRLELARIYLEGGYNQDAVFHYNEAFKTIIKQEEEEAIVSTYEEMRNKNILPQLMEINVLNLALFFEEKRQYEKAVKIFGYYVKHFPEGQNRPDALLHIYHILKEFIGDVDMAEKTLHYLKKEYPDFRGNS